jgi:AcrR family transcriptional regulator
MRIPDNDTMAQSSPSASQVLLSGPSHRRDQILKVAAELFATNGYTSTSMREVAASSGILAGSLYHHFASKEAIAVELAENYYADLVRAVRELGPVGGDAVTALRLFARKITMVAFRHPAALQITMFDAPANASSSLKTVVHAEPACVDRCWRTLISAASAEGAIRLGVDPRVLRHVLHRVTMHSAIMGWRWRGALGPGEVADCITSIVFDGLAGLPGAVPAESAASRVADELRVRWKAESVRQRVERPAAILDAARAQFALRGYEATTVRNIAEAAGITASNLYRYFESKESMIVEILGDFSDRLLDAYKQVIGAGAPVVETIDAILGVLDQAGRLFGAETEILRGYARLVQAGTADRYQQGAQIRFDQLVGVIANGVRDGGLNDLGPPDLVATCLREIAWGPMPDLLQIPQRRVREFHRNAVLSGAAARP